MLPSTVQAMSEGQRLKVAFLFQFEFLSRTMRFWDGVRVLTAGSQQWEGAADVISVSGLGSGRNMAAAPVTFTLSGANDELISFAAGSQAEVTNRPCSVYMQFMTADYVTLDDPIALWAGWMDTLSFRVGGASQQIQLTAEGLFVGRVRSQYAYYTDPDQQARWPGDLAAQFIPTLRNKTVTWLRG